MLSRFSPVSATRCGYVGRPLQVGDDEADAGIEHFRKKTSGGRVYLQIAQSRRVAGRVQQRVITTLGRLDELEASGQIERLVRSGARFAARAMVLSAAQDDPTAAVVGGAAQVQIFCVRRRLSDRPEQPRDAVDRVAQIIAERARRRPVLVLRRL